MERTTPTQGDSTARNRDARRHPDGLMDFEAAAAQLRCSPRMIKKLIDTRRLASVKVGNLVRIEPEAIDAYIERNRRDAVG